jgi:signal peptidase I
MSYIIYAIILIGYFVSFYMLFPKAGRKAWEGLIPLYNFFVLSRIIQRPWWWCLLLILPGVNIIMLMVYNSNLATVFGKRELGEQAFAVLLPFIAFPAWANKPEMKFIGQIDRSLLKNKKGPAREWGDAIVFAIVAASIIRTYFLEAFTIPTGSMEKSLLIGDFLFVSKMAYGPKVPQTPLSIPFFHHSIPSSTVPSYLEWIELPYQRLPGFGKVERNDIVVFNYPEGDTVLLEYQSQRSYEQVVRDQVYLLRQRDAERGIAERPLSVYENYARRTIKEQMPYVVRPVDKREHYIKRCVALPGDELKVEGAKLYINGETAFIPNDFQYKFNITSTRPLNKQLMKDSFDVNLQDFQGQQLGEKFMYNFPLPLSEMEAVEKLASVESVEIDVTPSGESPNRMFFPNSYDYDWSPDFFGPITIPAKGTTVALNAHSLPLYKRIITVYEGHSLQEKDGNIFIDGELATDYTFAMDYYFMMGDSRHNSADSRFWGFVPENHIVGEAAFIWMSLDPEKGWFDGKIRFDRMFTIPE